ncbi:MAG: ParB/RepB/Spo0J family partition protein [Chloroflexi bacterium]|uniref:ParB/RepB/Spo0J family partition protein n=1 Tax=Candidatus Chlorohelix allophototropha TaxID=3003348 RepID=A0A8T7M096_9CHLR|nr:ParB/RepB/Spo0J family partition protein [Chloroflexota bacterium]WJW65471.1 ParB/RepB/Spo0J family partition protein [Chloroflexota bacterium L227-S17]
MASAKKPRFNVDSLTTIMSGVAAEESLPDVRTLDLEFLFIGDQPRQLLGLVDEFENEQARADWILPVHQFLDHLKASAQQDEKSVAATSLIDLENMAQSIREHGVLQPVLVRYQESEDRYILTDGHRRALASVLAGNTRIEAKIKRVWTSHEILSEQLIANLQRKDLTALELARAISQLRELYAGQLKETEPNIHPNQLAARVWDRLEASLGIGRRQLQRLMQVNEFLKALDPELADLASDLKERQFRPLFRLSTETQPLALTLVALNKEKSLQDIEHLVERSLSGANILKIAREMGWSLPTSPTPTPPPKSSIPDIALDAEEEEEEELKAVNVKNVLSALKRMPRQSEALLRRLEEELAIAPENERKKRLYRIEEIEQEAFKLSRRLAEIRKKYINPL